MTSRAAYSPVGAVMGAPLLGTCQEGRPAARTTIFPWYCRASSMSYARAAGAGGYWPVMTDEMATSARGVMKPAQCCFWAAGTSSRVGGVRTVEWGDRAGAAVT